MRGALACEAHMLEAWWLWSLIRALLGMVEVVGLLILVA